MSERLPHLGILHYRDDVVFGKGQWTDFTKSCRGVVVDFNQKKILAQGYNKFFNLGEAEAPSLRELEAKGEFVVTEKLDGSMILLFWDETTKQFVATTKGSIDSEQGQHATTLIPSSVRDVKLVQSHTLMFELISPKYQIVVPYDKIGYEEGLYLIGVRELKSEKIFSPKEVLAFAKEYNLKAYKTYPFASLQAVVEDVKELPYTREGFVVVYNDAMVKIKGKEYLRVHRFISTLSDKNLLDVMIAGEDKNVVENIGSVPEEYRQDVLDTFANFKRKALDFQKQCYSYFADVVGKIPADTQKIENQKRKAFAAHVQSIPEEYRGFLFKMYDHKEPELTQIYMLFKRRGV